MFYLPICKYTVYIQCLFTLLSLPSPTGLYFVTQADLELCGSKLGKRTRIALKVSGLKTLFTLYILYVCV